MMRKIVYIAIALFSFVRFEANAQLDADACHFWSDWGLYNPGNIKPFYAGFVDVRGQQLGFDGQPFTVNADATFYRARWNSQIGGRLTYDYAGYTSTGKLNVKYAYSIGTEYDRVNLGLACGVSFLGHDLSKVDVDNTRDDVAYNDEEDRLKPNYNFGLEWTHNVQRRSLLGDELTVGASVLNLEDYFGDENNARNTINTMYAYSAYRYRTLHGFDFLGGALFQYYDTNRLQTELHGAAIYTASDIGGLDTYDKIAVGASYRRNLQGYGNNDITINLGWGITKNFYVGYAFDFVVEDNINKPFSTHEVFLQWRFINRKCVNGKFGEFDGYKPLGGR